MSKKDDKKKAQEVEEEDLDRDEDEDEDEDDEEDEAAQAKPVDRSRRARHEPPAHGTKHVEAAPPDQEDPYWWTPHAVLGALLLIGLLGFFGLFNKTPLAKLAAPVAPSPDHHDEHKPAATPPPAPQPQREPQPRGSAAQPPREIFGAKHLLVMYKGSRRAPPNIERSKDEAKARAEEAKKKAKADPSKFADLVKEYSDEPNAGARGGDLGKFPKGAMVPEFQAAVEKIKVGEISDVVETPFGFHVILRTQ